MTLGCDFYDITFKEGDDKLSVFIWDIASQKNFEKMRSYYLSYTNLTVIVVDVNRTETEYIDPWIADVKQFCEPDAPFLIALNKIDLLDEDTLKIKMHSLKQRYNVPIYATSAKTGENVKPLFDEVGKMLWDF
jgi:small GTP-binding protein